MRRTFWIAPTRWELQAGEDKSVGGNVGNVRWMSGKCLLTLGNRQRFFLLFVLFCWHETCL